MSTIVRNKTMRQMPRQWQVDRWAAFRRCFYGPMPRRLRLVSDCALFFGVLTTSTGPALVELMSGPAWPTDSLVVRLTPHSVGIAPPGSLGIIVLVLMTVGLLSLMASFSIMLVSITDSLCDWARENEAQCAASSVSS